MSCDKNEIMENGALIDKAIINGTVLPKGHGRLIDESEMNQKLGEYYYLNEVYTLKIIKETIEDRVPTVLEADKESNDDSN